MRTLHTPTTAAEILPYKPSTIRSWCASGEIRGAFKKGKKWLIPAAALAQFEQDLLNSAQQTAAEKRSKQKCQSISTNTEYGKYPFAHQAVSALDNLLAPETKRSRKNCTTN